MTVIKDTRTWPYHGAYPQTIPLTLIFILEFPFQSVMLRGAIRVIGHFSYLTYSAICGINNLALADGTDREQVRI
jgi:hypothetical protein